MKNLRTYLPIISIFGLALLIRIGYNLTVARLYIYDGWLYSESLYTFLMVAFTYSLYRLQRIAQWQWAPWDNIFLVILFHWLQRASWRRWMILSGVLLGLASLARPNGPFLIVLLFAWTLVMLRAKMVSWQTITKCTLIITCIAAILLAPWILRNYKATHTFILVATGGGNVLSGVYNDTALKEDGMWEPLVNIRPEIDFHGHNCC